jgi:hypothetical protein
MSECRPNSSIVFFATDCKSITYNYQNNTKSNFNVNTQPNLVFLERQSKPQPPLTEGCFLIGAKTYLGT